MSMQTTITTTSLLLILLLVLRVRTIILPKCSSSLCIIQSVRCPQTLAGSENRRNSPGNFMKIHKSTLNSVRARPSGVERKGRRSSPTSSAPDSHSPPPLRAPRCQTSANPGVRGALRSGVCRHPPGAHGVFAGRRWDRGGLEAAPGVGAPGGAADKLLRFRAWLP